MKSHLSFDRFDALPRSEGVYYECLRCKGIVPSKPKEVTHCSCKNIFIDERLEINNYDLARIFEETSESIKFSLMQFINSALDSKHLKLSKLDVLTAGASNMERIGVYLDGPNREGQALGFGVDAGALSGCIA
jgi:hypothetical protein